MWARVPASILRLMKALLPVEEFTMHMVRLGGPHHLTGSKLCEVPSVSHRGLVTPGVWAWLQFLTRKSPLLIHHSNMRIIPAKLDIRGLLWAARTDVTKELLKCVQKKLGLGTMLYL